MKSYPIPLPSKLTILKLLATVLLPKLSPGEHKLSLLLRISMTWLSSHIQSTSSKNHSLTTFKSTQISKASVLSGKTTGPNFTAMASHTFQIFTMQSKRPKKKSAWQVGASLLTFCWNDRRALKLDNQDSTELLKEPQKEASRFLFSFSRNPVFCSVMTRSMFGACLKTWAKTSRFWDIQAYSFRNYGLIMKRALSLMKKSVSWEVSTFAMVDGTLTSIQFMTKTNSGMELTITTSDWEQSLNHENIAKAI